MTIEHAITGHMELRRQVHEWSYNYNKRIEHVRIIYVHTQKRESSSVQFREKFNQDGKFQKV